MSSDLLGGKNSTDEDPIPLAEAYKLFPQARLTVSTLRAEAARGRLDIFRVGKRDYTTPAAMRAMVRRCRDEQKARDFTSIRNAGNSSSETDRISSAQAALRASLQRRNEC
jgi:hypothetical protein